MLDLQVFIEISPFVSHFERSFFPSLFHPFLGSFHRQGCALPILG